VVRYTDIQIGGGAASFADMDSHWSGGRHQDPGCSVGPGNAGWIPDAVTSQAT
jgi:hypothetical protein